MPLLGSVTVPLEQRRLQLTGEVGVNSIICSPLERSVSTLPGEGDPQSARTMIDTVPRLLV